MSGDFTSVGASDEVCGCGHFDSSSDRLKRLVCLGVIGYFDAQVGRLGCMLIEMPRYRNIAVFLYISHSGRAKPSPSR